MFFTIEYWVTIFVSQHIHILTHIYATTIVWWIPQSILLLWYQSQKEKTLSKVLPSCHNPSRHIPFCHLCFLTISISSSFYHLCLFFYPWCPLALNHPCPTASLWFLLNSMAQTTTYGKALWCLFSNPAIYLIMQKVQNCTTLECHCEKGIYHNQINQSRISAMENLWSILSHLHLCGFHTQYWPPAYWP